MISAATGLAVLALAAWCWLFVGRDGFWRSGPELAPLAPEAAGTVDVVVPARDEAESIAESLSSLLGQDDAGSVRIILVDDGSRDATLEIARGLAEAAGRHRLDVIQARPAPAGWSGKLWALDQGIAAARKDAAWLLLTDADIVHAPGHLAALLAKAESENFDLVSEMVALNCESLAERALVPAFVFFFQLLYPFAAVNDPSKRTAAAAGGTILLSRSALDRVGGIASIRGALIDDVTLAKAVKPGGRIWLGHTRLARSRRAYPGFADIWRMIARTAFVQLRYSGLRLLATLLGMAFLFVLPPVLALFATGLARWLGLAAWLLAAALYWPSLRRFRRSSLWAPLLPVVAGFYLAATLGSAIDHWSGRGQVWKDRAYREMPPKATTPGASPGAPPGAPT
ncbi:MAG: glycosyltransferase [Acetobacteraceae bacterium]